MSELPAHRQRRGENFPADNRRAAHSIPKIGQQKILLARIGGLMTQCQRPLLLHQRNGHIPHFPDQFDQSGAFGPMQIRRKKHLGFCFIHHAWDAGQHAPKTLDRQMRRGFSEGAPPMRRAGGSGELNRPMILPARGDGQTGQTSLT